MSLDPLNKAIRQMYFWRIALIWIITLLIPWDYTCIFALGLAEISDSLRYIRRSWNPKVSICLVHVIYLISKKLQVWFRTVSKQNVNRIVWFCQNDLLELHFYTTTIDVLHNYCRCLIWFTFKKKSMNNIHTSIISYHSLKTIYCLTV